MSGEEERSKKKFSGVEFDLYRTGLSGEELDIYQVLKDGNVSRVRELLETYDDVTERDIAYGRNALHIVAMCGHFDVAKLLVQNGADVKAVDKKKQTSLHFASSNGHVDVAKLLIQNGADVNAVTKTNWTSLHYVTRHGHVDVAKLLIQNGSDVNAVNKDNNSVLYFASCIAMSVPMTLELLCVGAKIDKKAITYDGTGLLVQIEERMERLRNGEHATHLLSNEEGNFMWNLKMILSTKHGRIGLEIYKMVRAFITFNSIFMAPGFDLGSDSIWKKEGEKRSYLTDEDYEYRHRWTILGTKKDF